MQFMILFVVHFHPPQPPPPFPQCQFDDVFIYDFFADSPSEERTWRVVTSCFEQQAEKAGEGTTDLASARAALAGVRATEAAAATAAMALLTEAAEAAEAAGDTDSTLWIAQQVCAMRFCLCVCVALGCIKTGQKRAVYETSKKCTHHRV